MKIRGFRIELGEIEAALLALRRRSRPRSPWPRADAHAATALVAYVGRGADVTPIDEIRRGSTCDALAASLPAYMVPAAFVVLDALPLNANGKLDRRRCPRRCSRRRPSVPRDPDRRDRRPACSPRCSASSRVGADDDFFDLGGNSLIATQVAARLGAALDTRVPVRAAVRGADGGRARGRRLEPAAGAGPRRALVAGPRRTAVPLSLAQQRMWFLNQFDPISAAYNIPVASG